LYIRVVRNYLRQGFTNLHQDIFNSKSNTPEHFTGPLRIFSPKTFDMKKFNSFHLPEKVEVALLAIGFLMLIMLLSWLFWYA